MSNQQTIATLVGKLRFEADYSALIKFEQALDRVSRKMDAMTKKAAVRLGLSPKGESKTAAQAHTARMREHKLEVALARAKKATFAAELQGQKLTFAGQKESQALQTASLRTQQAQAVLAEKAARAQAAQLKVDGARQRNQQSLEQAKVRQARLEKLLEQQSAKAAQAKARELREMTALQRAEMQLQQLRAAGARKARQDAEQRTRQQRRDAQQQQRQQKAEQARQITAQRQTERFQQSQQRFQWAQQRHARWQANSSKPAAGVGFGAGLDVMAMARNHPIVAGMAGLATAIYALEARMDKVTDRVSGSEQYDNIFKQIGGKNPDNVEYAKSRFFEIGSEFGTSVDMSALENYRKYILQQVSLGKSLEQATKGYALQQAAFRGAGMDKMRQERAAYQLSQIQAKGRPEGADVNDLFDAAPLLATPIRQAAADRLGFKGKPEELAGWFKKSVTDGLITAADFNKGMADFVRDNADIIATQQQSIDAAKQRLENDKIIQQAQIDQSEALKASIHERIAAERELVAAMKPVKEAMAEFDTALMGATARVLNFFFKPQDVSELNADIDVKRKVVEDLKAKGLKPNHPAMKIAESDLRNAQRALTDSQVKQKLPVTADKVEDVAPSLLRDNPAQEQVPAFLRKLENRLLQLPQQSQFLSPLGREATASSIFNDHSTTNTTRVLQVNATVSIDASSAEDVKRATKELENQFKGIARRSFQQHFDDALTTSAQSMQQARR